MTRTLVDAIGGSRQGTPILEGGALRGIRFSKHDLVFLEPGVLIEEGDFIRDSNQISADPGAWRLTLNDGLTVPSEMSYGRLVELKPKTTLRGRITDMLAGSQYYVRPPGTPIDPIVDRFWCNDSFDPTSFDDMLRAGPGSHRAPSAVFARPNRSRLCGCGHHLVDPDRDVYAQHHRYTDLVGAERMWQGGVIPDQDPNPLIQYAQSQDPDEVCADAPSYACAKMP